MSIAPAALLLVVASSLGWSCFDSLRKALVREIRPMPLVFLLTAASAPLFGAWALADGPARLAPGYLLPALGSVVLNVGANMAYLQALRLSPLSVTIPLLSLSPVFSALFAIPLLGERPGPVAALGILLVVAGAFWLHWPRGERTSFAAALRREPGVPLMAATALLWSATIPLDKLAVQRSSPPVHGALLNAGVALAFLLLILARGQAGEIAAVRRVPGVFLVALLVSGVALALQFVAFQMVWVSLIETLKRGIGNFMSVLLGRAVFAEAVTARKLVAAGLMAVGVAMILL